jgi:hypothetical protein
MFPSIGQSPLEVPSTISRQTSEVPITEWDIGQGKISLFYGARNTLVAINAREGTQNPFRSPLYSIDYAANLIDMFHRTIKVNLEREGPNSYCFLPKFCTEAQNAPEVTVALFGDLDTSSSDEGEPRALRWGVFNSSTGEEYPVEINDLLAETFIRYAPNMDVPHMEPVLDENGQAIMKDGQPIMKPALDHYAMTSYAQRFGVVIERDVTECIQNVILHRVGFFNKTALLDKNNWGATLVDLGESDSNISPLHPDYFSSASTWGGHTVIIIETIENGEHHIWRGDLIPRANGLARARIKELSVDEVIVILQKNPPRSKTWVREKSLVQLMKNQIALEAARSEKGAPIEFLNGEPIRFGLTGTLSLWEPYRNCTTWARERMFLADIHIPFRISLNPLQTPKIYINPSNETLAINNATGVVLGGIFVGAAMSIAAGISTVGTPILLAVSGLAASMVNFENSVHRKREDPTDLIRFLEAVTNENLIRGVANSSVDLIENLLNEKYTHPSQARTVRKIQAKIDALKETLEFGYFHQLCSAQEELAKYVKKKMHEKKIDKTAYEACKAISEVCEREHSSRRIAFAYHERDVEERNKPDPLAWL